MDTASFVLVFLGSSKLFQCYVEDMQYVQSILQLTTVVITCPCPSIRPSTKRFSNFMTWPNWRSRSRSQKSKSCSNGRFHCLSLLPVCTQSKS